MAEKTNNVNKLFCRLGLENESGDKLTPEHFLQISKSTVINKRPRKENELVHAFMQRLLRGDYKTRSISVKHETQIQKSQTGQRKGAHAAIFKSPNVNSERKQAEIDPMDVQMAVFLCADNFLQQIMVNKLSQCQYAIPLLVPNPFTGNIEFPLWTFRQINKSWKLTDASGQISSKTLPVYKAETPMVAFFRLGSVSSSKSQLINSVINEKHNTFFHRNCQGSSRTRLLMDGVVEIAWYCPSGKSSDHFTECVAFCNLHGDSSKTVTQREILTTMASVNVIFLPTIDEDDNNMIIVEEFYSSQTPLIVLTDEKDSNEVLVCEMDVSKYKVRLNSTSQSNVTVALRDVIKKCLSQKHMTFTLEKIAINTKVSVDEHHEACQRGKKAAQNIMVKLDGKDPLTVKEKYLPCQGKLWHDWCQKSKGLRRLQSNNIELELSNKKTEMKEIRQKQQAYGFSNLLGLFVDNLNTLTVSERKYFLSWTEICLDEFTSETLTAIREKYHQKWKEVLALKQNKDKDEEQTNPGKLKTEQSILQKLSKELNDGSFGLEHILREMGQVYESVSEEKSMTRKGVGNRSYLTELAAELMISGHPMELMNGDTAYVPLTWVLDVLNEVIKKLGDLRVFVLSVLGIQSSGKSTMLNAMFGLQFAVSAGRCTRGAFMQLLKVSKDMKEELKFDYILVVDTEGLRSGNNTIHHDNELSTFVVGLGNITLINIYGENPTEMQEILQIVVHAFLRMKQVRLNPSCMFVHQNVCDIAAREKIMDGRRHLQETLDKMTKLAAKDEDYYAENFTDVIAFDVERDVKYFAQLWEGSPPMAPPNPCYSENIQELKKDILSRAETTDVLKLSQFQDRVKDLWNALLDENFVFSFKNAKEISLYRKLEKEYGKWSWSLRSDMMTIEDKMLNRVASRNVKTVQEQDLFKEMAGSLENVQNALNQFFEEDNEKETLIQWKYRFETLIHHLHEDLIKEAKRKVDDSIQQRSIRKKLDQQHRNYDKHLFEKSKDLALKLKDNVNSQTNAKAEFDSMWGKWVSELNDHAPKTEDVDISNNITTVLGEIYRPDLVSSRKLSLKYKNIVIVTYERYISKMSLVMLASMNMWSGSLLKSDDNKSVRDLIITVSEHTKTIVESFPFLTKGYNSSYLHTIAKNIQKIVHNFEKEFKRDRKITDESSMFNQDFYVDLSLYVCEQVANRISELHRKFKEANDPLIYFEKKKSEYFIIFQKYWEGATSAAILGDQVCSKIKEAILQSVYNMVTRYVSGQMREKPPFNGNRADLEKHILMSLAEQEGEKDERFCNYLTYMYYPRYHLENFIKARVKDFMAAENSQAVSVIKDCIEHKKITITSAAKMATDEVRGVNGDANQWLEVFSNKLADELGDTRVHMCDKECKDSIKYDVVEEAIKNKLSVVVEELKNGLSKTSEFAMENFRERPDDVLIKHFCRCCWVQCPFCGAVCTNSQENHLGDHNADFHRPCGMKGSAFRDTTELSIEFCTTLVASEKVFFLSSDSKNKKSCKQYREAGGEFSKWGISVDLSELTYWKWFVCEFQENLEMHYKLKFCGKGQIPAKWKMYTVADAVASLSVHK